MTKTAWYPASVKPVREGLYEVSRWMNSRMVVDALIWTGVSWMYDDYLFASMKDCFGDKWRGLTEKAK